jgi:two-component system sensor histidine kinase SenX3
VTGEPSAQVFGERELLLTAVRNLVDNAVAYSSPGSRVGVVVAIQHGLVEVSVRDEGVGITEVEQRRIFERFYRVDPARSRATGGTGLGLAIVKHVAANHGGEVTVWSRLGEGSTFTLRLPLAPADLAPALSSPQDGPRNDSASPPAALPPSTPREVLG